MRLAAINAHINRAIQYRPDKGDYWQTPVETWEKRSGDCEDYAIAKLARVLDAGWPTTSARLVYCRRVIGRIEQAHMVLDVDGQVLDNLGMAINSWDDRPDLYPLLRFTATQLWAGDTLTTQDPMKRLSQWRDVITRAAKQDTWLGL